MGNNGSAIPEQKTEQGYISSKDLDYLLGKEGTAAMVLRPGGMGDFDGMILEVISEGTYISEGTPFVINKVKGSKLVVEEKKTR